METILLKHEPIRLIWYSSEELPTSTIDGPRWRIANRPHLWRPPTDVYETEDAFVIRVEIGGMRESDFSIFLDGRHLLIEGTRGDVPERRAYHQMEILFGEFNIDLDLSMQVAPEGIEAYYRDGFLKITLPKAHPHND